jgi:hypothetical protein
MLRFLLFTILLVSTFTLGSWAYKINYDSRAANQRVKDLEESIRSTNKEVKILNAEWAHLNSPDRLRKLVEYYFLELRLNPISPDDFISFSEIYSSQSSEKVPTALAVKRLTASDNDK